MKLETERLLLREIAENDWPHIHTYTSMPEVTEHTAWGPNTEEDTRAYVQDVIRMQLAKPREGYELAIVLKRKSFSSAAQGSTLSIRPMLRSAMCFTLPIRKWICDPTCRAILHFGFKELGVHRIYAKCRPENPASERVMQRIGMQREGLMREHWFYKGAYHDSSLYSMLDREFE